jgi:hypothetical protein
MDSHFTIVLTIFENQYLFLKYQFIDEITA